MKKNKLYSQEEIKSIVSMFNDGKTVRQISGITGRTMGAIYQVLHSARKAEQETKKTTDLMVNGKKVASVPSSSVETNHVSTVTKTEMTPREMIKSLYNQGYRIENNQLVCYVKQVVKINDIVSQ